MIYDGVVLQDLFEAIVSHAVDLARNQSGCCVLQDCLEHVADCEQKRRLINVIVASALDLSDDRYGLVSNHFYFI